MIRFRTSILATALGFAALASSPARADLYVFIDGTQQAHQSGNTSTSYDCNSGCADGFTKIDVSVLGQDDVLNPELLDSGTQNATASSGATNLLLEVAQTNMTAAGVEDYLSKFTGTINGNLDVTRTFYVDSSNGTSILDAGVTQLAQIVTNCASVLGCDSSMTSTNFAGTGGTKYSVIETIQIDPSGSGGNMSTDDFLYNVPEPVSLSLFGSGLLGLGALSRRRRKAAKPA